MASKEKVKKVSINALEKCVEESAPSIVNVEWRGIEVTITRRLSLSDMMKFVDGVTNLCFSDDGTYMPEIKDFATRCNVLEMYANFTLPSNIEKRYELVYACDVYATIMGSIDRTQFEVMLAAIDDKIDNRAQANVEAINRQMNELYAAFENLESRLSAVFDGIDGDTMKQLIGAMSNGKLDEQKLMDAYLDAKKSEGTDETDGE